jgi:phosphatidylinositol dimannoside acyltransferase
VTANKPDPVLVPRRRWWHDFAVQGIFWRKFVDWAARSLPAVFHPFLIWTSACLFFFIAAPARRAVVQNLQIILPRSSRLANYARVLRIFVNFGWALADAAIYKLLKPRFSYELEGQNFLEELALSKDGAVVLTAHMGNYDLAAALFAEKFNRQIHMVRAPEPDALSAHHVDLSLQQSSSGAVRVGYSNGGASLAFDLLNALRDGEIISIQGDRVIGEVARAPVNLFGRQVLLPTGPFVLSTVSQAPIYPLFMIRTGYRKYKIIAHEPIACSLDNRSREEKVSMAMQRWANLLEKKVTKYWRQWYAFVPISMVNRLVRD